MSTLGVRFLVLTIFLALRAVSLKSQTADISSNIDTSPYLLRIERMQPNEDTCVLIRENGQYHFERLLSTKMDIFEGEVSGPRLQVLHQTMENDQLRNLSQDKIKAPAGHSLDDVFLSISRSGHWQNLKLLGIEGRGPYREYVDPLLSLLEELPKEKHKSLSEDAGRNNCMPPGNIELASRPESRRTGVDTAKQYLMRAQITNRSEYTLNNTCVLVYPQGYYHMERWTQRLGSVYVESSVFEGVIGENTVQQLRELLDDPNLQNRPESAALIDFPVLEAEVTALSVRRGDHIQKLAFWKYIGSKAAGSVYTPPHRDNGTKLVKPLQQWLKTNLKPASDAEVPHNQANRCDIPE